MSISGCITGSSRPIINVSKSKKKVVINNINMKFFFTIFNTDSTLNQVNDYEDKTTDKWTGN